MLPVPPRLPTISRHRQKAIWSERTYAKGEELFEEKGCVACHKIAEDGPGGEIGPVLAGIGDATNRPMLAADIANTAGEYLALDSVPSINKAGYGDGSPRDGWGRSRSPCEIPLDVEVGSNARCWLTLAYRNA